MKKLKCKVCECEFIPEKKEHYVSRDEVKIGFSSLAGGMEEKIYDTFDCPQCGCQNVVGGRKRELYMGEIIENLEAISKNLEQEPFINKPCVSEKSCEHDKNEVLDKIRAEIEQLRLHKAQYVTSDNKVCIDSQDVFNVIAKYKVKSIN